MVNGLYSNAFLSAFGVIADIVVLKICFSDIFAVAAKHITTLIYMSAASHVQIPNPVSDSMTDAHY